MEHPLPSRHAPSYSKHKRRSSEARHLKRRIGPRPVSWISYNAKLGWHSSRAESSRADYPMCENSRTFSHAPVLFAFSSPEPALKQKKSEKSRSAQPAADFRRVLTQPRRKARLQASPREGPESARKPPFHCDREIRFTTPLRHSSHGPRRVSGHL
jgi:hypothetical protein